MKDEWTEWQAAWNAGARSLPEIQALADKQRRRMILGVAGIWAIGVPLVVGSIAGAILDPSWVSTVNAAFQCVVVSTMIAYTHGLMRGNWREATETPDAQLALMERRWSVRRRMALFVRWGGLAIAAFVELFCVAVALWVGKGERVAEILAGQTAFVALIAVVFWFVSKRQLARCDAALAELAAQRRELDEG